MKEALSHILDQSVCLTRRQMKDYLAGSMLREEQHAAELHLASCPLCSLAMEGFEEHSEEALAAIASLNSGFLKEHYDAVTPQIHLNSVAPVMTASVNRKKGIAQPLWRNLGIAASILLAVGFVWFMKDRRSDSHSSKMIADNTLPAAATTVAPAAAPPVSAAPMLQQGNKPVAANAKTIAAKSSQAEEDKAAASGAIAMKDEAIATPPQSSETANDRSATASTNAVSDSIVAGPVVALGPNVRRASEKADLSIGGGRTSGSSVVVDGAQYHSNGYAATPGYTSVPSATSPQFKRLAKPPAAVSRGYYSSMQAPPPAPGSAKAKALADKKESNTAAKQLKDQMESGEGSRRSRHIAGIQSAKAYIAAGQKAKAIAVLNTIIAEGGSQKKAAKKLLKELQQ